MGQKREKINHIGMKNIEKTDVYYVSMWFRKCTGDLYYKCFSVYLV